VFVEEYSPRFFAGETATRQLRVYNDRMVGGNLTLRWRSSGSAWQTRSFTMQPAEQRRETVTFTTPMAPGPFMLDLEVADGTNTVFTNGLPYSALARPALSSCRIQAGVYDPEGAVAALFARFRVPFALVTNLRSAAYDQFNLLVVAATPSLTTPCPKWGATPSRRGGRISCCAAAGCWRWSRRITRCGCPTTCASRR